MDIYFLTHIYFVKELEQLQKNPDITPNNTNKKVKFKNCGPFTNCLSRVNNSQVDGAHDTDVVMLMYKLIKHDDNY